MGMPQIPPRNHKPEICEVVTSLIEAVAIEELAIAHIINAEGEKLQEVIKKFAHCHLSFEELEKIYKNTNLLMNNLIMKEWILLSKMNSALDIYQVMDGSCKSKDCKCGKNKVCADNDNNSYEPCKFCGNPFNNQ